MNEFDDLFTKIYPYFLVLFALLTLFLFYKFRHFIFNRGFVLMKNGNYDEALMKFKAQLEKNSRYGAAYYGSGWCYYMLGYGAHAIKNFKHAIDFKFREVESYFLIAVLYSEEKKFEKAFECIEKGKEIQKKKTIMDKITAFQMNEIIGWIYYKKNDIETALEYYEKAIPKWEKDFKRISALNLSERFSSVYYRIGIIYKLKNEIQKSKEFFEKSKSSSPNSIFAQKSKEELKKYTKDQ